MTFCTSSSIASDRRMGDPPAAPPYAVVRITGPFASSMVSAVDLSARGGDVVEDPLARFARALRRGFEVTPPRTALGGFAFRALVVVAGRLLSAIQVAIKTPSAPTM